jgi:hypothetical protein
LLLLLLLLLLRRLRRLAPAAGLNFDEGQDKEGEEGEGGEEAQGHPDEEVGAHVLLGWSFWKLKGKRELNKIFGLDLKH